MGCAGQVATGGEDGCIKIWDARVGGGGPSVPPVTSIDCLEFGPANPEVLCLISAGALGGEGEYQLIAGG
jgi:hypothetical protein